MLGVLLPAKSVPPLWRAMGELGAEKMPLERICGVGVLGRVDVVMPEMTSKVPSNHPRCGVLGREGLLVDI